MRYIIDKYTTFYVFFRYFYVYFICQMRKTVRLYDILFCHLALMKNILKFMKPKKSMDTNKECTGLKCFPKGIRCAMIIVSLGLLFFIMMFQKEFIEANCDTNIGMKLAMLSVAAIYPVAMSVFYLQNNWKLMKANGKCGFFSYATCIIPYVLIFGFIMIQAAIQCIKKDYNKCSGMFQSCLLPATVLCFLYSICDFEFDSIRYVYADVFDLITDIAVLLILITFMLWHMYINNIIEHSQNMYCVLYPVGLLMIIKAIKECFSSPRDLDFKKDSWLMNLFILAVTIGTVVMVCVKMIVILNRNNASNHQSSN
ncbi:hypothetical protein M896_060060 [Ordospora colligata OC4]|uniref:Uncharacterized protein n=1 Tax=Ordospora colligata OC4 TaxID=1354746 RepID=A0A0B2UJI1_9MICR|nr:uncharacterized protein M896_060060 [Ordospora colligata OC4]KHN69508.1 hypothetical protein M896_060060 [Ordospora colligata OC4]TBU15328.1 hypothetical protein CWI41_060050 [Ordospora colligata]TBU15428.1 hypothetical protein CWI40_060050 [Ordospora colligata]